MMFEFLIANRADLIERCRTKVIARREYAPVHEQLQNGVPLFLDQLTRTLLVEQTATPLDSRKISGASGGDASHLSEMGISAKQHGGELLKLGYTIDEVVHNYGDLCQAITDLAFDRDAPLLVDEFRTLNRCLDNAIADAVKEFSQQSTIEAAQAHTLESRKNMDRLRDKLLNHLATATLAFSAARSGHLGLSGATGKVLERSLVAMSDLIHSDANDSDPK